MCGIVGYVGSRDAVVPVLEGLQRLEYRGYDSAGISFKNPEGKLQVVKKEGKLDNLRSVLETQKPKTSIAIGHTRWATHGHVNETNAHPHGNDLFAIVHNGIIENAFELKESLQAEGEKFHSETDTEVFLVLLTKLFKQTGDIKKSIIETFKQIEGNSAVVILNKDENKLYAIKRSAPLVCGRRSGRESGELFLSSDPYALVGYVDRLFFPDDEILCELDPEATFIHFYDLEGNATEQFQKEARSTQETLSTKGEFEHFMLKEIHEQPFLTKQLAGFYSEGVGKELLDRVKGKKFDHINIIGCGTAWHAGLVIKNILESELRVKVTIDLASEFRYRDPVLEKNELALFISQSGETADTIACAELCKKKGLTLYSIVNVKGSTLYRMSDENFLIYAGQEIGVASTKAFTNMVLVGALMAFTLKGEDAIKTLGSELNLLSDKIEALLSRENELKIIAKEIFQEKGFIYTGRNIYFPIALEGALKLKEIAYVHAEGYAAGELKHGPIALIDEQMVNISIVGSELFEKTLSNTEEVKARRGKILVVGVKENSKLKSISDFYFGLDFDGLKYFSPVLVNVVMQILSYYIAKEKGTDIDKPRNLAKSVTVE